MTVYFALTGPYSDGFGKSVHCNGLNSSGKRMKEQLNHGVSKEWDVRGVKEYAGFPGFLGLPGIAGLQNQVDFFYVMHFEASGSFKTIEKLFLELTYAVWRGKSLRSKNFKPSHSSGAF